MKETGNVLAHSSAAAISCAQRQAEAADGLAEIRHELANWTLVGSLSGNCSSADCEHSGAQNETGNFNNIIHENY